MKLALTLQQWLKAFYSNSSLRGWTPKRPTRNASSGFGNKLALFLVVVFTALLVGRTQAQDADQAKSVPDHSQKRPESFSNPMLIEFKGPIDRKFTIYFKNRFALAKKAGADLLIIEIDSPGGLKNESLEMARMLRDCKWAYTVALIENEAISGGALVSLGCDEIHINPNAKYGDIGIIQFDFEEQAFRFVEAKIESYLVNDARGLAESLGRPPALAESMIDKDALVYQRENETTGETEFKVVRADAVRKPDDPWKLIPETGPERFLTLSGQRAVELGIGQGSLSTRSQLATVFNFSKDDIRVYQPTTTDSVVYFLNAPLVTGLLVLVGLVFFYIELSAPGIGIGGLVSGLCAILFFWSKFLGGTAGWLEVILFLAGVVFLFTEIFVIPGFGVPGITGLVLLFASVLLASQDFVIPQTGNQWNQTITSAAVMACTGIGFIACAAFISKRMGSIPIFNQMILSPTPERSESTGLDKDGKPVRQAHPSVSVGDWGVADSLLRPAGRAKFAGRSFDVISDGAYVESGTQVRVIKIYGNVITVAVVEDKATEDSETANA